jgi:hypothetical protein
MQTIILQSRQTEIGHRTANGALFAKYANVSNSRFVNAYPTRFIYK